MSTPVPILEISVLVCSPTDVHGPVCGHRTSPAGVKRKFEKSVVSPEANGLFSTLIT